jgi:hypothetical protein
MVPDFKATSNATKGNGLGQFLHCAREEIFFGVGTKVREHPLSAIAVKESCPDSVAGFKLSLDILIT